MKHTIARILISGSVAGSVLFAGAASAIDWNITGFVRQEIGYNISSSRNTNNDAGTELNNRITPHITHAGFGSNAGTAAANSAVGTSVYTDRNGRVGGLFAAGALNGAGLLPAGTFTSAAVDCQFGQQRAVAAGSPGFGPRILSDGAAAFPGTVCPGPAGFIDPSDPTFVDTSRTNFNLFNTRVEVDVQAKISKEWSAYMKIRGYYDGTRHFTDAKTGNHFENPIWGDRGTILEWNSPDAIIDIPAFYVDWNRGPLWIRAGNQTIAWGEAYFFRTMDVANGLDLRRHLTLGPGAEEYQDQRIASPGVRVSYTFNNGWELDAFVQMFSPTILPGQNTPYNLIPTRGARLDDQSGMDDAQDSLNYGARLTMPFTDALTGVVAVVNRRNPDGVFTNTDANTFNPAGTPNNGCLNTFNDTLNVLANGAAGPAFAATSVAGVNANLAAAGIDLFPTLNQSAIHSNRGCGSSFSTDPRGTKGLQYWEAINSARLNQANYLQHVINDFPAAEWAVRDIFGFGNEETFADVYRTVEAFRSTGSAFVQWVGRQFKRETIFMGGANYLIQTDDPNSIFDQLIVRGEIAVTPNKKLTNDLAFELKEVDDVVSALIFEKYHRISDSFPATYMVFQWMHRTSTDLFGRDLDKNDAPGFSDFVDPVTGNFTAAATDPNALKPRGTSNANYVVFAFQQPFPNLIWRFDFAILVDVAGGYLVQPGLRYRPAADWQWDLYANIIESPGGDNDTITETIDFADEIFLRLTYYF